MSASAASRFRSSRYTMPRLTRVFIDAVGYEVVTSSAPAFEDLHGSCVVVAAVMAAAELALRFVTLVASAIAAKPTALVRGG
eukprot:SAG31_NODE_13945_length_836_cov_0.659430_2_plen_81_part_01